MNHYEIVFIFNPDEKQSGKSLLEKIKEITKSIKGKVHRSEEIGSRRLTYPIKDFFKGEYFLLNIECNSTDISKITELFKFNENVLRTSVLAKKKAETSKSALFEQTTRYSTEEDTKDVVSDKKVSKFAKEEISHAKEVVEEVKEKVEEVAETAAEVVEEVKEKVEEVAETAAEVVEEVKEKAEEVAETAAEVVEELKETTEEVVEEVKETAEKVAKVTEKVVDEAKEKAKGVFAKVKNVFKSD